MNGIKKFFIKLILLITVIAIAVIYIGYKRAQKRICGVYICCESPRDYEKSKHHAHVKFPLHLHQTKYVSEGRVLAVRLNDGTLLTVAGPASFYVSEFEWRRNHKEGNICVELCKGSVIAQIASHCSNTNKSHVTFVLPHFHAMAHRGRVAFHVNERLGESLGTVLLDERAQCVGKVTIPQRCRTLRHHRQVYRTNGRRTCTRSLIGMRDMNSWFEKNGLLTHHDCFCSAVSEKHIEMDAKSALRNHGRVGRVKDAALAFARTILPQKFAAPLDRTLDRIAEHKRKEGNEEEEQEMEMDKGEVEMTMERKGEERFTIQTIEGECVASIGQTHWFYTVSNMEPFHFVKRTKHEKGDTFELHCSDSDAFVGVEIGDDSDANVPIIALGKGEPLEWRCIYDEDNESCKLFEVNFLLYLSRDDCGLILCSDESNALSVQFQYDS